MGLDITPNVPPGRQVIEGYGGGGFRIAGRQHDGSVLVFPDRTVPWQAESGADITLAALGPMIDESAATDLLVIGCGARFLAPPAGLRAGLKQAGLVMEWMDTGAACRTFNVLLTEGRRAAAALIAVD